MFFEQAKGSRCEGAEGETVCAAPGPGGVGGPRRALRTLCPFLPGGERLPSALGHPRSRLRAPLALPALSLGGEKKWKCCGGWGAH